MLELVHENRSGDKLEIVIPTFNEEKRIGNFLHYYGRDFDIVLLDDDSADRTVGMAIEAGATVFRRTDRVSQAERHFVYYANELTRSGMCFWLFADEFIERKDLVRVEHLLRQQQCAVYGRRIDWVYGKRVEVSSGVNARGFRKGYAHYDSGRVHGNLVTADPEERPRRENTFDVHHLSMYSMRRDFGKIGSYVFCEVEIFRSGGYFLTAFTRRYVAAPLKAYVLQTIKSRHVGWTVLLHGILINLAVLTLAILCWLEQACFPSQEEIRAQYEAFYHTD
jgi:glycosyltransferase involved in cell wall biosynthesis